MVQNPQKDYKKRIESVAINPLKCSDNFFNKETKKYQPGKRYSLYKNELSDYITVASNEIVFELDAKAYSANYSNAKKIIEVLKKRGWPFYIYSSAGKGIHIQCWFDKPDFKTEEIKKLFENALAYNLSFRHIRFWLWNLILDEAGIKEDLRGMGKVIDSSCLNFLASS